ncbi:MAG TPA: alpha/beta hydrolase [Puia sp.]|nr:alpha/beta hydrolase [Puia sp.]
MKRICLLLMLIYSSKMTESQIIIPLYPDGKIPNSKPVRDIESTEFNKDWNILIVRNITRPTLTAFIPPKAIATGTAVLICPGGGYSIVAAGHEGFDVAKRLNEFGIAAFVLKYRLPNDTTMVNKEIGPLQDAQRAMEIIRENAKQWQIDEHRVGVMGFSAGGHLASTVATHFNRPVIDNAEQINLRPDFAVLIYPVISFANDSIANIGTRDQLLGKRPQRDKEIEYSSDLQVNRQTPPSFLVHAEDDDVVKVQNSLVFYDALQKFKIPSELIVYPKGGHGFGLNIKTTNDNWIERLKDWLDSNGWLNKKP